MIHSAKYKDYILKETEKVSISTKEFPTLTHSLVRKYISCNRLINFLILSNKNFSELELSRHQQLKEVAAIKCEQKPNKRIHLKRENYTKDEKHT